MNTPLDQKELKIKKNKTKKQNLKKLVLAMKEVGVGHTSLYSPNYPLEFRHN